MNNWRGVVKKHFEVGIFLCIFGSVFNTASESQNRYSQSEIKMVTVVNVKKLGKQVDDLSAKLRVLDIKIQALNFATDLVE